MEASSGLASLRFVMGRLKKVAPGRDRRGHSVRARAGERLLSSSTTDSSGRFLLEWRDDGRHEETAIELIDSRGDVSESLELTAADLLSPPVVIFSGERVVGFGRPSKDIDGEGGFQAEGDYPLCVTSSCLQATLSWTAPPGSRVSIISDGGMVRAGLPPQGILSVLEDRTRRYTRRVWPAGAGPGQYSEKTLEVKRYPSLSLVVDGRTFETGSSVEFGASTSCPAGGNGLTVRVATSDSATVPPFELTMPAGSKWASTRVILGRKTGLAEVTAFAQGYARDAVFLALE
ncbi:MAG: hypothetical protein OK474_10120 [Thaumarchaeota archaeon]|nr:hypothetical protein [Nitrososphaerota archaeon]